MKVPTFESPQNNAMDYYWFDQLPLYNNYKLSKIIFQFTL